MHISASSVWIDKPLVLPPGEVHLWRLNVETSDAEEAHWKELLSADEIARAARFHFARDRQHFTTSRALLRTILASYLDTQPCRLTFAYSKKEKPFLDTSPGNEVSFNVSHSGGSALMAFAREREIGIDIEQIRPDIDLDGIARRFFSQNEQNQLAALAPDERIEGFFRCWTRKE